MHEEDCYQFFAWRANEGKYEQQVDEFQVAGKWRKANLTRY